jgi:hypothetical protein
MFLSTASAEYGHHELDFRFEVFSEGKGFLFAHHGAKLNELMEVCGLSALGRHFLMVEMAYPMTFPDVLLDKGLFFTRYGVEPWVVFERYFRFDASRMERFFESTRADSELDCTIFGGDQAEWAAEDIDRCLDTLRCRPGPVPLAGLRSWIHTHDNHFLWLGGRSLDLLRRLIASSLVGFFNHVHSHPYSPVPDDLIDLVLSNYHTAPLVCFPTEWDWKTGDEVATGVRVECGGIRALVETAESSWIAYRLNPPRELVGRGLLIAYQFERESWTYEERR